MVVATKKSGDLHISLDPRPLNKALKHEHYPPPVMQDILPKLLNTKSLLKTGPKQHLLACAYRLRIQSSYCIPDTIWTPLVEKTSLWYFSLSSELFQMRLNVAPHGLDGVVGV